MSFNYAKEKRIFEAEWRKLAVEYSAAGFDAKGIKAMRDFDWELFCQRRANENREQPFPSEIIDDGEDDSRSTLLRKFPALTSRLDKSNFSDRYRWIEKVSDSLLAEKLAKLSSTDKELLTLLVFDKYMQIEIAAIQGCTKQAVSKRFNRIKKFLK